MKTKNFQFQILSFKFQEGFTLLETIVAIFVITAGIVGTLTLITQTISSATFSSNKLIASYLTQEGIEVVRNIRDTNWLEGGTNPWDEGLTGCSTGCITDYTYSEQLDPTLPAYADQFLNIDANGYYSYSAGTPTKFKRKITITQPVADQLNVIIRVEWQEKGKLHKVEAQENLYNWR